MFHILYGLRGMNILKQIMYVFMYVCMYVCMYVMVQIILRCTRQPKEHWI
jgi:uncharacterized membrane protein